MPTYDMRCDACGNRFERFLMRMLRDEDRVCPVCGSREVREGIGGGYVAPAPASGSGPACDPGGGFA